MCIIGCGSSKSDTKLWGRPKTCVSVCVRFVWSKPVLCDDIHTHIPFALLRGWIECMRGESFSCVCTLRIICTLRRFTLGTSGIMFPVCSAHWSHARASYLQAAVCTIAYLPVVRGETVHVCHLGTATINAYLRHSSNRFHVAQSNGQWSVQCSWHPLALVVPCMVCTMNVGSVTFWYISISIEYRTCIECGDWWMDSERKRRWKFRLFIHWMGQIFICEE